MRWQGLANTEICLENAEIPGVPSGCRGRESVAIRHDGGRFGAPEAAHRSPFGCPRVQKDNNFHGAPQADPLDAQGVKRCAEAGQTDRNVRL
jgi:hypothetical protein